MEVLLMAILSLSNIACFLIGAKVGQKVVKGESIEVPTVNPLKAYQKHQEEKAAEFERNKYDTIMQNIEAYDGTANGQKDV